jgi:hypothetical protein
MKTELAISSMQIYKKIASLGNEMRGSAVNKEPR